MFLCISFEAAAARLVMLGMFNTQHLTTQLWCYNLTLSSHFQQVLNICADQQRQVSCVHTAGNERLWVLKVPECLPLLWRLYSYTFCTAKLLTTGRQPRRQPRKTPRDSPGQRSLIRVILWIYFICEVWVFLTMVLLWMSFMCKCVQNSFVHCYNDDTWTLSFYSPIFHIPRNVKTIHVHNNFDCAPCSSGSMSAIEANSTQAIARQQSRHTRVLSQTQRNIKRRTTQAASEIYRLDLNAFWKFDAGFVWHLAA